MHEVGRDGMAIMDGLCSKCMIQQFLAFRNPGVLRLQFPEAFSTSCAGQGFLELHSKNTSVTHGWKPLV